MHGTTEGAAVDVAAFVSLWFETFSEYKGRPFHMTGESYGVSPLLRWAPPSSSSRCCRPSYFADLFSQGRYLPIFASAVADSNRFAAARNVTPVNLQSVAIGNGWTDSATMFRGASRLPNRPPNIHLA